MRAAIRPDLTLVIPDRIPPHKELTAGSPEPAERLLMTMMAFADEPGVEVSDMELHRSGKSYTADTVRELSACNPDAELYLVIGTDMLTTFEQWHDFRYLLAQVTLVALARTGDEHAGVEAVLVLAAHFGEVVVDVLQDVTQADALGMAHDAHAVHGRDELFQAFFHKDEKVFQGNDLGMGILDLAVAHTIGELGQLLVQQADAVLVLAGEDVARIREPVVQALDAFFDSVVHNLLRRLTLMEGDRRGGPSARSAGCGRCWPAGSPRWT